MACITVFGRSCALFSGDPCPACCLDRTLLSFLVTDHVQCSRWIYQVSVVVEPRSRVEASCATPPLPRRAFLLLGFPSELLELLPLRPPSAVRLPPPPPVSSRFGDTVVFSGSWVRCCDRFVGPLLRPVRGSAVAVASWVRCCCRFVGPPLLSLRGPLLRPVPGSAVATGPWVRRCCRFVGPPLRLSGAPRRSCLSP